MTRTGQAAAVLDYDSGAQRPRGSLPVRYLVLAGALIYLVLVLILSGASWPAALYRLLTDGVLILVWFVAAYGLGSLLPLPRGERLKIPQPMEARSSCLFAIITKIAFGLGLISLATLGLGLIGWLSRASAVGLMAAGVASSGYQLYRRLPAVNESMRDWLARPASWNWLWLAAVPLVAIATVGALVPPGLLWGDEPHGYDVLEYHLQVPREWYEIGRIVPLEHNVFSFFPFNVEMHYLLAMHLRGGPWAGMYLAQLMHAGFFVLTVAAIYGLANELTDRKQAAVLAALATTSVPWLTLLAPVAYNEGGLMLFGTLAIGWITLAIRSSDGSARNLLIAGIMTGFACGTKLTAVPMLLVGLPVALSIVLLIRDGPQIRRIWALAVFAAAALLVFAPWMARNVVWTGNPIFPEGTALFGQAHFSDVQVERWKRAHSAPPGQMGITGRVQAAPSTILLDWRFGYVLIPLGFIAGLGAVRRPEVQLLLILLVLLLLFWLGFTHLQGRFFVLAIPILALMISAGRWDHFALVALIAVFVAISAAVWGIRVRPRTTWTLAASQSALGIERLDVLLPVNRQSLPPDATLVLIGEARAFLYPLPTSRLRYRTVFDVQARSGQSILEAWGDLGPIERPIYLIDPLELVRFSRTYHGLPSVPESIGERKEMFMSSSLD